MFGEGRRAGGRPAGLGGRCQDGDLFVVGLLPVLFDPDIFLGAFPRLRHNVFAEASLDLGRTPELYFIEAFALAQGRVVVMLTSTYADLAIARLITETRADEPDDLAPLPGSGPELVDDRSVFRPLIDMDFIDAEIIREVAI